MVKKLLKYEFKSMIRIPLILWGIVLLIACTVKILSLFKTDSVAFNIIYGSDIFFLVVGCTALVTVTTVLIIVRFYKNLYSSEGYLSFTLPVSEHQHIFVKTFVSFVLLIGGMLVCFVSMLIAANADFYRLYFDALSKTISDLIRELGTVNIVFYVIESILAFIVSTICGILVFYACLSIGQLARRRKVLLSIGVYAGLYTLAQIIMTVFMVIMAVVTISNPNFINEIDDWINNNVAASIHIALCSTFVINAVGVVLFYLATYLPMKKRLNLE